MAAMPLYSEWCKSEGFNPTIEGSRAWEATIINYVKVCENSAQQLKPKMPLLEEVYQAFCITQVAADVFTKEEERVIKWTYEYISRHFGR